MQCQEIKKKIGTRKCPPGKIPSCLLQALKLIQGNQWLRPPWYFKAKHAATALFGAWRFTFPLFCLGFITYILNEVFRLPRGACLHPEPLLISLLFFKGFLMLCGLFNVPLPQGLRHVLPQFPEFDREEGNSSWGCLPPLLNARPRVQPEWV